MDNKNCSGKPEPQSTPTWRRKCQNLGKTDEFNYFYYKAKIYVYLIDQYNQGYDPLAFLAEQIEVLKLTPDWTDDAARQAEDLRNIASTEEIMEEVRRGVL